MDLGFLRESIKSFDAIQKKLVDEKITVLKEYFIRLPNSDNALRLLEDDGLPKIIYLPENASIEIINGFKMIAPVGMSRYLNSNQVVFSWGESSNIKLES